MSGPGHAGRTEFERQQWLLAAIDTAPNDAAPAPGGFSALPQPAAGLAIYRANAAAVAERALAAAYPTVQQLLGESSFAALAQEAWHRHPPTSGDLALWDGGLLTLIGDAESLADEPYLSDVARLDWAFHRAAFAADGTTPAGLQRLASDDPEQLWLQLAPGTAMVPSRHPVVTIWQAHRRDDATRFDAVRLALAADIAETALVQRYGLRTRVQAVDPARERFTAALLRAESLAAALTAAGEDFDFEPWLLDSVRDGQLRAVVDEAPALGF